MLKVTAAALAITRCDASLAAAWQQGNYGRGHLGQPAQGQQPFPGQGGHQQQFPFNGKSSNPMNMGGFNAPQITFNGGQDFRSNGQHMKLTLHAHERNGQHTINLEAQLDRLVKGQDGPLDKNEFSKVMRAIANGKLRLNKNTGHLFKITPNGEGMAPIYVFGAVHTIPTFYRNSLSNDFCQFMLKHGVRQIIGELPGQYTMSPKGAGSMEREIYEDMSKLYQGRQKLDVGNFESLEFQNRTQQRMQAELKRIGFRMPGTMNLLHAVYMHGDSRLMTLLNPGCLDHPTFQMNSKVMFADRNLNWMRLLAKPGTYASVPRMCVVGCGHLYGPNGLLHYAEKANWKTEQLNEIRWPQSTSDPTVLIQNYCRELVERGLMH